MSSWITTDGHGRPTGAADGSSASWNADGELQTLTTSAGQSQMAYDGMGRLTQVTLPDGRVGRYRYDALGRRVAVRLDGQLVRRLVYGASLWPQARVDAAGDVLERYVYASQAHVPDVIVRRDGQRLRLVLDVTGSVRAAVDADSGVVLQRLSYDAYGRVTQDTNPGLQPFGYKGAFSDPVAEGAGLVWMGVRAYTPKLARFTTPDPVGLKAGWNQHDALAGDPVNMVDADGRVAVLVVAAVATVAAVLVVNMSNNAREARERQLDREWDCNNLIPPEWGNGRPNRDGEGRRWQNPKNRGDGVRIDKGNPDSAFPSQRGDHVVVNDNGKVIGRDGRPIQGSIKDDPENAHIPREEWNEWENWNHPSSVSRRCGSSCCWR